MIKTDISILVLCYNHEKFIKRSLDSILSQCTKFTYEIIVCDDCSTDQSRKIIDTYNNPKIKKIYNSERKGSFLSYKNSLSLVKGTFLAICDGDDFWCDKYKLEIQVNEMIKNNSYISFHPVYIFYQNKNIKEKQRILLKDISFSNLLKNNYIYSCSVIFNIKKIPIKNFVNEEIQPLDWFLNLNYCSTNKYIYIERYMSVYCIHNNNNWFNKKRTKDWIKKHYHSNRLFYKKIQSNFKIDKFYEITILDKLYQLCISQPNKLQVIISININFLLYNIFYFSKKNKFRYYKANYVALKKYLKM